MFRFEEGAYTGSDLSRSRRGEVVWMEGEVWSMPLSASYTSLLPNLSPSRTLLHLSSPTRPLILSPSHIVLPLTLSPTHPLIPSPSCSLTLSFPHPLVLSHSHSLALLFSHPLILLHIAPSHALTHRPYKPSLPLPHRYISPSLNSYSHPLNLLHNDSSHHLTLSQDVETFLVFCSARNTAIFHRAEY